MQLRVDVFSKGRCRLAAAEEFPPVSTLLRWHGGQPHALVPVTGRPCGFLAVARGKIVVADSPRLLRCWIRSSSNLGKDHAVFVRTYSLLYVVEITLHGKVNIYTLTDVSMYVLDYP